MKALWARYAPRIDALSLRERVIMFVVITLVVGVVVDQIVITPLLSEQTLLATQMQQQAEETRVIREQLQKALAAQKNDSMGPLRTQLQDARAALKLVEQDIATYSASADAITRLPELMNRLLRTQNGLTLVRVATVPVESAAAAPGSQGMTIKRSGMDIVVKGNYLDLMRYLETLEKTLPALRWGALTLSTDVVPAQLSVRIYLVSVGS